MSFVVAMVMDWKKSKQPSFTGVVTFYFTFGFTSKIVLQLFWPNQGFVVGLF